MVPLDEADFILQGFDPIARDGASICEVGMRMQKLLATIAEHGVLALREPAQRQAALALRRAAAGPDTGAGSQRSGAAA